MAPDERLVQFLKNGKDWERKATSIPGVFLLKLPQFKGRAPSLAIEVNPVDASGAMTKKRGVVIRSASELEEITKLLVNPKIEQLARSIDEVNPERKPASVVKAGEDVFEI
ncbi:MAG TPA: hypothetical protein VNI77_02560 [Nitrososphaera sp.]|nr:hypothetical protein [Nitrososphaera sp.]